jgi:pyochelin synthetase
MSQELLTDLYRRGIKLRLTDGRLDVIAPSGTLTPALRDRLTSHRDDLIALLSREGEEPTTAPIVPRPQERHEPFPLTDIQHAYWVGRSSAVELGGVSTHLYFELERDGLDTERLTESLRRVIDRHDMLRAVVLPDGRQRVLPEVPPYEIAVADVGGLPARDGDRQVERTRAEMDHQVLPADRWPLFDIRATRFDGGRLRLHVSFDVLILDGLSLFRLFQDWRRFYEEPDWSPAPLELSYRDHVLHEEAERDGAAYKEAERYWTERLESLPPAPALPLATQPGQLPATRFTRRQARLPREAWTAVKDVAQERGVTPSAVLMAAFCEVLRAWSSQSDFTLNLTLFNRPAAHPDIDKVIGDFTTLTMLEVHAEPDVPFTERVRRVQQQLIRDLEHLSYSGVRVQRERSRRLGSGPGAAMPIVFTSALVLGSAGQDPTAGLRFFGEQVYGLTQTPQVWLDHQVSEEQGELKFHWDAVADLFPEALLDDMFSAYRGVLDLLCRDAGAWDRAGSLAGLPKWQAEERAAASATGSVAGNAPADTLCGLVEAQARRAPDATAVICGDTQLSYGQLVDRAHGLARRLADLGAAPNTLVGVVLDKGWEQIAAALGVTRAGAAYLPVDPEWPEARRERLLDQGRASLVVTTPRLRDQLSWPAHVRLVTLDDRETGSGDAPVVTPDTLPAPDDLAYVIYTSGSTGEPKGVMIDHRGAVNTILDINARFGVGPADRVLALSALSFDLSVYDMFGLLAAGGCVVMPTPEGHHDPTYWTELVELHGVTVWNSVPALMQTWVDSRVRTDAPPSAGLRLAMLSGDWVPVRLPDQVRALYPDAQVVSLGEIGRASWRERVSVYV